MMTGSLVSRLRAGVPPQRRGGHHMERQRPPLLQRSLIVAVCDRAQLL